LQEMQKPFPSRSFVMDVLEFLRLLCEGHNTALQDFLREQSVGSSTSRVDLVTEVFSLFEALEKELDDDEQVAQAIKCVETLTEFCQGNVSMKNSRLLQESKLIDICGRLVVMRTLQGVSDEKVNNLRDGSTKMLMALLEGTDRNAERRMLLRLDLHALAHQVVSQHTDIEEREESRQELGLKDKDSAEGSKRNSANAAFDQIVDKGIGDNIGKGIGAVGGQIGKLGQAAAAALDIVEVERANRLIASRDAGFSLFILLKHLHDFEMQDATHSNEKGGGSRRVAEIFDERWF